MTEASAPKLSICIPTYKGEKYIVDLLNSIHSQNVKDIEIVITDDSPDENTKKVVSKYKRVNPKYDIKFFKNKSTLGFDKNVLEVVGKASGMFCWLLGQDDKLLSGSLKKVLGTIRTHPDAALIYSNYTRYDEILKKITSSSMINISEDKVFKNKDNFFFKRVHNSYFQFLGTNVITMSTDIINRDLWKETEAKGGNEIGYNFIHCFMIARMLSERAYVVYLGKPYVWYRSNNHRVWPNDIWKDYNQIFIDYLIKSGYDKNRAKEMRKAQIKYEKREAAIKKPGLNYAYKIAQPVIGIARMVMSKLNNL